MNEGEDGGHIRQRGSAQLTQKALGGNRGPFAMGIGV
jgi:hypothetical protein